jgi:hypothetical protein
MASAISKQPKHKKRASKDRTCITNSDNDGSISSKLESMYKSVSSSAASVEDSIKSSSSTLMSDLAGGGGGGDSGGGGTPNPSASSSSISAASTATTGSDVALTPSIQSKVSESFMLSKMPRKYFSDVQGGGANPFLVEDNYGKI